MKTIVQIVIVLLIVFLMFTMLKLTSNMKTTKQSIELIADLLPKIKDDKLDKIIEWHKKYGHPLYAERSIKYFMKEQQYNRDRMTIVIPLSYFFNSSEAGMDEVKWLEWSNIIKMPLEIEKKCIDYIALGRGSVDFTWGVDCERGVEKVYLEDENIYGYVYSPDREIIDRYVYHKKRVADEKNKFSLIYLRTKEGSNGQIDSYHLALRKPLVIIMNGLKRFIHLISYSKGESYTFYYRAF